MGEGALKARILLDYNLSTEEYIAIEAILRKIHPPMNLRQLIDHLLRDMALMKLRPGSWEGANMLAVMRGHGFLE